MDYITTSGASSESFIEAVIAIRVVVTAVARIIYGKLAITTVAVSVAFVKTRFAKRFTSEFRVMFIIFVNSFSASRTKVIMLSAILTESIAEQFLVRFKFLPAIFTSY
jgi:hypothetical protein